MQIDIALHSGLLKLEPGPASGAGAVVLFEGRVRGQEQGESIPALDYEAYQPMAEQQMEKIALELGAHHPCLSLRVRHRVGRVPVGEAAILVEVCSKHRAEAFALVAAFMDRIKQDVPIWKALATS